MGQRGPVPNRSEDLARPRSRKGREHAQDITNGTLLPVEWPEPDASWHQLAIDIYEGCRVSGQAALYQQSDIAILASLCDDLSYAKRSGKRSGQLLQTIYSGMERLLVTEGDRRRVRVELQAPPDQSDSASVLVLAEYHEGLELTDTDESESNELRDGDPDGSLPPA